MAVMKKKPTKAKARKQLPVQAKKVTKIGIVDTVTESYLSYGTETIEARALSDFRDGLNPVQRRILWAAYTMGLTPDKAYKKAATITGVTMGNFHPHGNLSIDSAMAGLVHTPVPLIDGMGGWGAPHRGEPEANSRYTEAKLSAHSMALYLDKDLLAVSTMVPSFDGSHVEPLILPAALPMSLVLGAFGIAVAATTNIPAFTIESVTALVKAALQLKKGEEVTPALCNKHLRLLERNGGQLLSDAATQRALIKDGVGSLDWQCEHSIDAKKKILTITGIAPEWAFSARLKKLRSLPEVRQVKDLSSGEGPARVEVHLKAAITQAAAQKVLEAIAKDSLNKTVHYRFNVTNRIAVTEDGMTQTDAKFFSSNAVDIVQKWLVWRLELESKSQTRIASDLQGRLDRENLLLLATKRLDALIKIIRAKGKDKAAKLAQIAKLLPCSKEDAAYVLTLPIGRFDRVSEEESLEKCKRWEQELKQAQAYAKNPAPAVLAALPSFTETDKPKARKAKKNG